MIKIDTDKAFKMAKKIQKASEDCGQVTKDIKKIDSSLGNYWQGDSYKELDIQLQEWAKNNSSLEKQLDGIQRDIKNATNKMAKADIDYFT